MRKRTTLSQVHHLRLKNVRAITATWTPYRIASEMGWGSTSFLSQMIGPNPSRSITERTARRLETKLSLPYLSLDR